MKFYLLSHHANANHSQSPRNSTLSCTSTSAACASSTCSKTRLSSSWSSEILALRSVYLLTTLFVALSNFLESAVVLLNRTQSARDVALPAVVSARSLHETVCKNLNSPQARLERVYALCFLCRLLHLRHELHRAHVAVDGLELRQIFGVALLKLLPQLRLGIEERRVDDVYDPVERAARRVNFGF